MRNQLHRRLGRCVQRTSVLHLGTIAGAGYGMYTQKPQETSERLPGSISARAAAGASEECSYVKLSGSLGLAIEGSTGPRNAL